MPFTINPAGIAPIQAPNVIIELIHVPCSLLMCTNEFGDSSNGNAGDDHDNVLPAANALKVAVIKVIS